VRWEGTATTSLVKERLISTGDGGDRKESNCEKGWRTQASACE